jgi:S1-C subfamily serine protease
LAVVALAAAAGIVTVGNQVVRQAREPAAQASAPAAAQPVAAPVTSTTSSADARPEDAVYLITVDGCGIQGTGSGFAVDAHHVVTNAHVVQADAHPQLRSPTGERYVGRVVGLSGVSPDGTVDPDGPPDVALIELDVALPAHLRWSSSAPAVGQVLSGMTFPDGAFTPTTGTVVSSLAQGFEIRGDFDHGSSGGPVLSADGRVEGIVTGGAEGGGRAFAFAAAVLRPAVEAMLAAPAPLADDCAHAG